MHPVLPRTTRFLDDERRPPMCVSDHDRCRGCRGYIGRTDSSGLCWSCMPC